LARRRVAKQTETGPAGFANGFVTGAVDPKKIEPISTLAILSAPVLSSRNC
jgi:hypothetical protein